jgi:TolB-like protein/Tfp pilus assembly protein PilF/tRNA A-37 threonylcarbamoyl transferase component Bud32
MIGQQMRHFRIVEKIGAGGMGEVYRAHDEQLDRDVAIKVLPAGTFRDETARARLLREARTASKLNHPHICTIHEVGEAEGQAYIAMELVEGQPLSARLADGALPPDQVLRYALQLADALAHAHERGVVHRDLKSANVIVTPEGRAKVLDFGLAKRLNKEELDEATTLSQDLSQPGTVVGTLAYMPPEQLRGEPADARSDVWALGVMLHEMASGERPFQGKTGFELSSAILNQPPSPLPPEVPAELRGVIERCLEKEPGRRYQRGGEVRAVLEAIQSGSAIPAWSHPKPAVLRRRWVALVAAAVVMTAGIWLWRRAGGGAAPRIDSLAVLPLQNLSGDPQQDYFADGIHEALITDLAKLSGFSRVIARSSVMRYRNTDKPLPQIARELGVAAVITGSVLREGNLMRVTAQLVDAATEQHLWADRYERQLRDVLSLQNDIVGAIARAVNLRLTPREQVRLAGARPVNPETYDLYLKGMSDLNQYTPEAFKTGMDYLYLAVEKDPSDARAWAALATGYGYLGHAPSPPPEALPRAKAVALKALELDETLAEAHTALAEVKMYYDWDFAGAEQSFRRALELNPNLAEAHAHYGWYLDLFERTREALAEMRRSVELDPLRPIYRAWLGTYHLWLGQNDAAIAEAQKAIDLRPDFPMALLALGAAYGAKGMLHEAIAAHEKAAAKQRRGTGRLWLAGTYARAGREDDARKILAGLKEDVQTWDAWFIAEAYAALGEKDEAFRWLERAYEYRHSFLPWMGRNPAYKPLRSDPRFRDLMRRMNLPQ